MHLSKERPGNEERRGEGEERIGEERAMDVLKTATQPRWVPINNKGTYAARGQGATPYLKALPSPEPKYAVDL